MHASWHSSLFGTMLFHEPGQADEVEKRAGLLFQLHRKKNDCLILAEAEAFGASKLISYDTDFINRLSSCSFLELVRPSDHWDSMAIAPGSRPKIKPNYDNPVGDQLWWCV